ncbi:MAG: MerR family transcriptional regulator [Comamonas sp.]|jgi:DNA-binding transcriptional MerR regulator|uniref:MerR family transcriptional regulator n=1 Tax=Comamonas sp. TaxID=34028 RepID=UPI00284138C1|nr:MerR family transcriptional regulator [Comamonas sp.]MDR3066032.1 MerR family transcriptional regulator [Comamonas sp.]
MRIVELAALTGCTPKALRLYEAHGLLGTVARRGSYRSYGPEDVQRVHWIRQAQALGFRLAALQPLRAIDTSAGAAAVQALIRSRRRAIARELACLQAADAALAALSEELAGCEDSSGCSAADRHLLQPRT